MHLTDHQRKIIKLLRDNFSQKQAAAILGTSRQAVTNNLLWLRKRHGIASTKMLLEVTAGIDLDRPVQRKRLAGIKQSEAGSFRVSIWIHHEICPLGTHRTRAQALKIREEALKLKHAGHTIAEIRQALLPNANKMRGVDQRDTGQWRARISTRNITVDLGSFSTEKQACEIRLKAQELKAQGFDALTIKSMLKRHD